MFDCPMVFHGAIDPENRSNFGSLGIDHFSRSKAQWRKKVGYKPSYADEQAKARRRLGMYPQTNSWNLQSDASDQLRTACEHYP